MVVETVYEVLQIKQVKKELGEIKNHIVCSPNDAYEVAAEMIEDEDREVFLVMMLNTKNRIVAMHRAHVGSLNASIVHPREVFKAAILNNAASIVVSHQHPSGDPTPSREDRDITRRLVEAGKILGIEVLDHIVIGDGRYYSFKEQGNM